MNINFEYVQFKESLNNKLNNLVSDIKLIKIFEKNQLYKRSIIHIKDLSIYFQFDN